MVYDCQGYRAYNPLVRRLSTIQPADANIASYNHNAPTELGYRRIKSYLKMKSKTSQRNEKAMEEDGDESGVSEPTTASSDEQISTDDSEEEVEEDVPNADEDILEAIDMALNETAIADAVNATEVLDPQAKAIADLEAKLQREVDALKSRVTIERINEGKLRDKISESGKVGFYMVQAKVTDFQVSCGISLPY
jgi:hypothetical protein